VTSQHAKREGRRAIPRDAAPDLGPLELEGERSTRIAEILALAREIVRGISRAEQDRMWPSRSDRRVSR
jgi:hypothetical protein